MHKRVRGNPTQIETVWKRRIKIENNQMLLICNYLTNNKYGENQSSKISKRRTQKKKISRVDDDETDSGSTTGKNVSDLYENTKFAEYMNHFTSQWEVSPEELQTLQEQVEQERKLLKRKNYLLENQAIHELEKEKEHQQLSQTIQSSLKMIGLLSKLLPSEAVKSSSTIMPPSSSAVSNPTTTSSSTMASPLSLSSSTTTTTHEQKPSSGVVAGTSSTEVAATLAPSNVKPHPVAANTTNSTTAATQPSTSALHSSSNYHQHSIMSHGDHHLLMPSTNSLPPFPAMPSGSVMSSSGASGSGHMTNPNTNLTPNLSEQPSSTPYYPTPPSLPPSSAMMTPPMQHRPPYPSNPPPPHHNPPMRFPPPQQHLYPPPPHHYHPHPPVFPPPPFYMPGNAPNTQQRRKR
ncbi:hypothetical protein C9374_010327 [Naegleria lovaniensis]|uniref:Uncharacterized protein n=1 Tax=Naegleria lovaniensis TaxID=51637 RepID=A0AA88GHH3_NAELO|nr:uncharacterized protein C9374_010327 [Naegleria lovaniensis]KAG2374953.1 hypothetical protein C9374_010327 [Naegleria lovaniensis]